MSYQVLARKWRPRNFQEMAGQGHVLKTLINALDHNRLHHAYLFTGTRGVGKTTIARILARCLNCEKGITSTPCGECSACREISEGRFIDLIEVDAASRTKVEDTRELLDNVQYAPSRGRFKIYLIDEVHMLSNHSFNALLKTLEEPPPHVKFLLATTDPQKLPVTVLSRCLQFNLKNLSPERLVEHLKHILEAEQIPFEEGALWQLGRAAQGSARDCLTLLDQAIGFCEGKLTDQGVAEFLGNLDRAIIARLMDALIAEDAAALLQQVAEAAENSPDFAVILQELQAWLHRVAIAQVVPGAIDNAMGDREQVLVHAAALPAESVQLYYQIALKSREDLPWAIDARSGLEMALLRMLAFTPAGIPKVPTRTLAVTTQAAGSETPEQKKKPLNPEPVAVPAPQRAPDVVSVPQHSTPAPAKPALQDAAVSASRLSPPMPAAVQESSAANDRLPEVPRSPSAAVIPPRAPTADAIALADLKPSLWVSLFRQLELSGVTRSIAGNTILSDVTGNRLTLALDERNATLYNEEQRKRIEQVLSSYFAVPIELHITLGKPEGETPAAYRLRREQEHRAAATQAFNVHPVVRQLVGEFAAEIRNDSITPLGAPEA
jgi:DNA polymerase-3 subunit gamma/tau